MALLSGLTSGIGGPGGSGPQIISRDFSFEEEEEPRRRQPEPRTFEPAHTGLPDPTAGAQGGMTAAQVDALSRSLRAQGQPAETLTDTGGAQATGQAGGGAFGDGSGGGGGGGLTPSGPGPGDGGGLAWQPTYEVEGAPEWWQGLTPTQLTPETELASLMNSMIPFMSPEDQRTTAQQLSRAFPDAFGTYDPEQQDFGAIPTEITTETQRQFESSDRAQQALATLTNMAQSAGLTPDDFGPGFEFLRQILDVQRDFGGGGEFTARAPGAGPASEAITEGQTRQERAQIGQQLEPLLGELQGRTLASLQPLVQRLAQPGFSAGPLRARTETRFGNVIPGAPNPRRFV